MASAARSKAILATFILAMPLSGCGVYFHSDAFQKKTDAAADAVQAAQFAPRIAEIGTEAAKVSTEYEASIVRREIAFRDRLVVAVVKKPLLLEPLNIGEAPEQNEQWFGLPFLQQEAAARLDMIVGADQAETFVVKRRELLADFKTLESSLERKNSDYAESVAKYHGRNATCDEIGKLSEQQAATESPQIAAIWRACKSGAGEEAVKSAVKDYTSRDLSCEVIGKLPEEDVKSGDLNVHGIWNACREIKTTRATIEGLLFGKKENDETALCQSPAGELAVVYCGIRKSEEAARISAAEKARLDKEIKKLAESYKKYHPTGVEKPVDLEEECEKAPAKPGDKPKPELPPEVAFLCDVRAVQTLLQTAEPASRAFGYDRIAEILKDALTIDVTAAVAETEGVDLKQTPAPTSGVAPEDEKIALAAAAIRVVTTGVKYGRAYTDQPPFDRANTAIIALAQLRHAAGAAEIQAQTEIARAKLLRGRLEALVREAELLAVSLGLLQNLADTKENGQPINIRTDLVSLPEKYQPEADAALGAYVASVNRGRIVNEVFKDRLLALDIKKLDAVSRLSGESVDKVTKAAADALRVYGQGGMDPAVVLGAILGALAVVGIWL